MRVRLGDFFDLRSGVIAALLMGGIVGCINLGHGLLLTTTAALKQGAYTFLMGGVIMRFCTLLATLRGPDLLVLVGATLLPSAVTILGTFFVHSLKGTPEPVASTIPVALISFPTFSVWALKTRRSAGPGAAGGSDPTHDADAPTKPLAKPRGRPGSTPRPRSTT